MHIRSVLKAVASVAAITLVFSLAVSAAPDKKDKQVGRLLFGKVLDPQDNPRP